MKLSETAQVLTKLSAYDQRTIGDADVRAWHEILGHLPVDTCLQAVTDWYAENSHRAMPADIRRLASAISASRRGADDRRERDRQLEARRGGAELSRTGASMCRYVLGRLAVAGQDTARGHQLGAERAAELAEAAADEWLEQTQHLP